MEIELLYYCLIFFERLLFFDQRRSVPKVTWEASACSRAQDGLLGARASCWTASLYYPASCASISECWTKEGKDLSDMFEIQAVQQQHTRIIIAKGNLAFLRTASDFGRCA